MRRALVTIIAALVPLAGGAASAQTRLPDEDGYDLWLRYRLVSDAARLAEYRSRITHLVVEVHFGDGQRHQE
jgi:alpha-glucuronidase